MSEILGFVRLENDIQQNCRVVKTIKSFRAGETVLREKPLVECGADSDVKRVLAFLKLKAQHQNEFMKVFTDLEMAERGSSPEDVDLDGFQGVLDKAGAEDQTANSLSKREAAAIILRWRLARHVSKFRVFKVASKMLHHCGAPVSCEYRSESDMAVVVARSEISPQSRIGIWALEDVDSWWKGANVRHQALIDEGILTKPCRCDRCMAPDVCRALKCPDCGKGVFMRDGKAKKWKCQECTFEGSDEVLAGFIQVETQLLEDMSDVSALPKNQLQTWVDTVDARLGLQHWLAGALFKEIHQRFSGRKGERSFRSVGAAMNFLQWLHLKKLPPPPEELHGDLVVMGFAVLEFLQARMMGVRDLRCIFYRALAVVRPIFESINSDLSERLKLYTGTAVNMRRRCSYCKTLLPEDLPEGEQETLPPSQWENDDDFVEEQNPVCCAVCKELWYCDLGCQMADMPRHRPYCVPADQPLYCKQVTEIMLPTL